MSPRDRWQAFDRPYAPRVAVEGGVRVPRPGTVADPVARDLVDLVVRRTSPGIGSRGRTYARQGQVVELRLGAGTASAAIQGSDSEPYAVSLEREADDTVEAGCSCPYGCDEVEWCKHAAALAYVVADLLDRDPAVRRTWAGGDGAALAGDDEEGPEADGATIASEDLADLLGALRAAGGGSPVDARAQWAAAFEVLPPPR